MANASSRRRVTNSVITFVVGLPLVLTAHLSHAAEMFGPARFTIPTRGESVQVISADVNRDHSLDLVVANDPGSTVQVFFGDGLGAFTNAQEVEVSGRSVGVAAEDLNGDGELDLLVANKSAGRVNLFLGGRNEPFVDGGSIETAADTSWVTTDDVNGDRVFDVVTAHPAVNEVGVHLGRGSAAFDSPLSISVMGGPVSVLTGDFDSDAVRDLAVICRESDSVTILHGSGDGTFVEAQVLVVAGGPTRGSVADFNLDGLDDLAIVNYSADSVSVFLGNGDASFQPRIDIEVAAGPVSIAAHDFNGDRIPDIALASAGQRVIALLIGDGSGNFARDPQQVDRSDTLGSRTPVSLAAGDFNRDGVVDLTVTSRVTHVESGTAFLLSVLLGDGFGGLVGAPEIATGRRARWLVADDFDGDGHLDIAATSQGSNDVTLLMGDGRGEFALGGTVAVGQGPRVIRAGDVDVDGDVDLIVSNLDDATISVLRGDGNGLFFRDEADVPVGGKPRGLALGDLNRDGWPDLVVGHDDGESITILYGMEPGVFDANSAESRGVGRVPLFTLLEDLDQDGSLDVVVVNEEDDNLMILWADGRETTIDVGDNPRMVAAVDLTGDGIPDLVVPNLRDNTVSILRGDAGGRFSRPADVPVGLGPTAVGYHDFNGDGHTDLAVVNLFSDTMTVLLGDGSGGVVRAVDLDLPDGPLALVVGDFNEDERPDLAIANYVSDSTTVLLNSLRERMDANGSNRVDGFDVVQVGLCAGAARGDSHYRRHADVNLDEWVDGEDLAQVAAAFGDLRLVVSPLRPRLEPTLTQPGSVTLQAAAAPGDFIRLRLVYSVEQASMSGAEMVVDFSPSDGTPTQVLELVGKEIGTALRGGGVRVLNIDAKTLGRATISLVRLPEESEPVEGDVILLTMIFRAIREGEASIDFVSDQSALYNGEAPLAVSFVGASVVVGIEGGSVAGQSIHVSPTDLQFRHAEPGQGDSQMLRIVNRGYSDLVVNRVESGLSPLCGHDMAAVFEPTAFTPLAPAPFTVPAFGFVELGVRFEPPSAGSFAGCLVLDSNDDDRPVIGVSMYGEGD